MKRSQNFTRLNSRRLKSDWMACPRYDDGFTFTFTFMHLADAFIQSNLHCIQVTVSTFYQLLLSLGIEPMILALLAPCSTSWATGKLQGLSLLRAITKSHNIWTNTYIVTINGRGLWASQRRKWKQGRTGLHRAACEWRADNGLYFILNDWLIQFTPGLQ